MPPPPAGSMMTLEVPTVLARSKSLRTSLKCRKMLAARLFEPFARVLRSAVFQNRRVNELIHSLGNGIMQALQAVHTVFLAGLRKGIERLLRRGNGLTSVDLIRHGDLADNRVVGRVHQVNDLGSTECDELAVDVGAIKGSYQSCGFVFVHLRLPL